MKEYKKKIEFKEIQSLEYNLLKRFHEFLICYQNYPAAEIKLYAEL